MYKAVISDLDGTLLNDRSKISDFTRETVRELIDKGIKFYIATGRNYGLAKAVMDELGITIPLMKMGKLYSKIYLERKKRRRFWK